MNTPMDEAQTRELRHELRTPVNHLIGYAELLLEEEGLAPAGVAQLQSIRAVARQVLELMPGIINADGTLGESAARLRGHVGELEVSTAALRASPGALPPADLDRLTAAAARLGELARRLATGTVASASVPGVAEAPRPGRLETILVVDDDEANRDVLGRRLQRLGYGVIDARDGVEALERMAAGGVDLVLLDVMMPRLDGFAVLERHRADPAIRDIPVIMISALDDMTSVVRCIEAGAEDYLTKPFDPVLLKARIGACMEKKHLREQRTLLVAQTFLLHARTNTRFQQHRIERLRQVILGAGFDAAHDAGHVVERRDHDDRYVADRGIIVVAREHRKTVETRHHHVEQYQIDAACGHPL